MAKKNPFYKAKKVDLHSTNPPFRFINRANVLLILIFLIQKSPYRILNNPLLQNFKQSQDIIQIRHYQQQNQDTGPL